MSWVKPEYLAHIHFHSRGRNIARSFGIEVSSDWGIISISVGKRIFHEFEGWYILFYSCIFCNLGVFLLLNYFEKEVLDHVCVPPLQLHLALRVLFKYSNTGTYCHTKFCPLLISFIICMTLFHLGHFSSFKSQLKESGKRRVD